MMILVETKGHYDFIDLTDKIALMVRESNIENGAAVIFVSHTTAALTIMEYEDGTIQDLIDVFEKMAPENGDYKHQLKWNDKNGAAHIKSALVGQDLYVPIIGGEIHLGTWQRIVLIDFDEKPRTRKLIVQMIANKCGNVRKHIKIR